MISIILGFIVLSCISITNNTAMIKENTTYILNKKTPCYQLHGKQVTIIKSSKNDLKGWTKKLLTSFSFDQVKHKNDILCLIEYLKFCSCCMENAFFTFYPIDYGKIENFLLKPSTPRERKKLFTQKLNALHETFKDRIFYFGKILNENDKIIFIHESWLKAI